METTPTATRPVSRRGFAPRAVRWGMVVLVGLSAALLIDMAQQTLASDRVAWAELSSRDLEADAVTAVSSQAASIRDTTDRPRLIRFTADWCGPCQTMKAQVFAKGRVADAIHERFVPFNVDLTHPNAEQQALGQRYAVRFVPTLLITDATGREISRLENAADADAFLVWLDRGWDRWNRSQTITAAAP